MSETEVIVVVSGEEHCFGGPADLTPADLRADISARLGVDPGVEIEYLTQSAEPEIRVMDGEEAWARVRDEWRSKCQHEAVFMQIGGDAAECSSLDVAHMFVMARK